MAGGSGTRFGASLPKQMVHVQGIPILVHTLRKFLSFDSNLLVCTVMHPSLIEGWDDFATEYFSAADRERLLICPGGATRTDSVKNGLTFLAELPLSKTTSPWVAIHDGVRPLISHKTLTAAYAMAQEMGNAVVAVPVKSSMRRKTEHGSEAVDRSLFYHVQTPQIFGLAAIHQAYLELGEQSFTDDAGLAEAAGMDIHLCDGDYANIKITTPEDLYIAEFLIQQEK